MENTILDYLKKHTETVYSVKTLAKRTAIKKKKVFIMLVNELKNEETNIVRVKPKTIGSHHRDYWLFKHQ
jgi:hypothetical protein